MTRDGSRFLRPASAAMLATAAALAGATALARDASPARDLEQAARRAAQARVAPPDRFKVLSVRGGRPLDEDTGVEIAGVAGPNASGVVSVTFRAAGGERRVSVRGRVFGPAVVALRTLQSGVPIDASGVAVVDTELTRLTEPPLRHPEDAFGLVPRRTLGTDRVLTRSLLDEAPVVRRGDTVDLVVRRRGMTVRAPGRVRRDGSPGDVVPAENLASGTLVLCRVRPDASLVVIRRAAGPGDTREAAR